MFFLIQKLNIQSGLHRFENHIGQVALLIVDTYVKLNSAVSHHSLQHGHVGRFSLNVSFYVIQSLWAVGIDTAFQIPPQKEVTRGQIG